MRAKKGETNAMTRAEIERARMMRRAGMSWDRIDIALGLPKRCSFGVFQRMGEAGDGQRAEYDKAVVTLAGRGRIEPGGGRDCPYVPPLDKQMPRSVLDERDRRLNAPRSLSASILGDPPDGYSALDRRT